MRPQSVRENANAIIAAMKEHRGLELSDAANALVMDNLIGGAVRGVCGGLQRNPAAWLIELTLKNQRNAVYRAHGARVCQGWREIRRALMAELTAQVQGKPELIAQLEAASQAAADKVVEAANRKYQDSRGREWYALHVRTGEERDVAMDVYALGDADSLLPIERYVSRSGAERERVIMPGLCVRRLLDDAGHVAAASAPARRAADTGRPIRGHPEEQMSAVMALYWHRRERHAVVRAGGVTQVSRRGEEVAHEVTCADERQGIITVALDLPGGTREVTMHAEFIKPGVYEKHEE